MPSELQDLLQRIPTAEEGGVITSTYHNSLCAALQSLASQVGAPMGQTLLTLAPGFLPNDPAANWPQHSGIAILSLEVADLGEMQARARAAAEASAAAATTTAARARSAATALNRIPAEVLPIATIAATASSDTAAKADDAVAAARALAAAVAESDAEAKANDAVAKAEAALTAAQDALNLASTTQLVVNLSPVAIQYRGTAAEAHENAEIAASSASEAFESANTAAAVIREITAAQPKASSGTCAGWLPVQLPDGAHIQHMVVSGGRRGTTPRFQVNLVRQRISDSSESTLIALTLVNADDPFQVRANVQGAGIASAESTVDNTLYKYLITARVDAVTGAVAQINAIQVAYSR